MTETYPARRSVRAVSGVHVPLREAATSISPGASHGTANDPRRNLAKCLRPVRAASPAFDVLIPGRHELEHASLLWWRCGDRLPSGTAWLIGRIGSQENARS